MLGNLEPWCATETYGSWWIFRSTSPTTPACHRRYWRPTSKSSHWRDREGGVEGVRWDPGRTRSTLPTWPRAASPHVVHPVVVQPETVGAVGPVDQQLKILPDAENKMRTGDRARTRPHTAPHALPTLLPANHTLPLLLQRSYYFAIFSNITRVSSSVSGRIFPRGWNAGSSCLS